MARLADSSRRTTGIGNAFGWVEEGGGETRKSESDICASTGICLAEKPHFLWRGSNRGAPLEQKRCSYTYIQLDG
jgi:hypothetical protein